MLFVSAGVTGGLLEAAAGRATHILSETWRFGRHTSFQVLTIYSMRMAGAFTIVTIGRKLGILPRWLAVVGAAVGIALVLDRGVVRLGTDSVSALGAGPTHRHLLRA